MRTVWFLLAVLMFLALLAPMPGFAQANTGEISGVVRDRSGGVLPGASVIATHEASGTVIERTADGEGRYFLPALRIGEWHIVASLSGFTSETRRGLMLDVGRVLHVEFTLDLQGVTEQVTVSAPTPL